jgi:hypothetical protein
MKAKIYLLTGLLFISASTQAAFHCTVDVNKVLVYNNGAINVMHSGRNDYTLICNLKIEAKGVSIPTCASLPTYGNAPIPVYIGDV